MTEIPIQRKHERSPWPWLLGLAALLLIAWYLFAHRTGDRSLSARRDTAVSGGAISSPSDTAATSMPR
ncbi:MAG TPA: hypothetical protein VH539_04045 [Gemmatimonadaceae bacterium]|jgi:hypothetical protein